MTRHRNPISRRRSRLKWPMITLGIFVLGGAGGYPFYLYRKNQNTLKLLDAARSAEAAADWKAATHSYRLYLQRQPSDVDALYAYTRTLLEKMDPTPETLGEGIRSLRRLVRLKPDDLDSTATLVQLYLAIREYASAEELAQQWSNAAPQSVDAALTLAQARHGLHKDAQSADGLIEAIDRMPDQFRLYPPLIELLAVNLQRPDRARTFLDKALAVGPNAFEIQLAAFSFFDEQKDNASARKHLDAALDLAPDSPRALIPAARYFLNRGDLDQAGALLQRAQTFAPDNRLLLTTRTEWAIRSGSKEAMMSAADSLLQHAQTNELDLTAQAASLFIRACEFQRADQCIATLAQAQRSEDIGTWLAQLRGARAIFNDSPYEAIPHLQAALQKRPNDPWTSELLALAYLKTGAQNESAELYKRISGTSGDPGAARLALARIAWQQGRCDEVRAHLASISGASKGPPNPRAERAIALYRLACDLEPLAERPSALTGARLAELRKQLDAFALEGTADVEQAELLARCFILTGQHRRIVDWLRGHIAEAGFDPVLALNAGRAMIDADESAGAIELAELMQTRLVDSPEGYMLQIEALVRTDRLTDAREVIAVAPLANHAKGRLWNALADACIAKGTIEDALAALRIASGLIPEDVPARRKLARYTTDLNEALSATEEIKRLEGAEGMHWKYERAAAFVRLNPEKDSLTQAANLLRECLSARPACTPARLLLGFVLENSGDLAGAADAYRAAIADQPQLAIDQAGIRLVDILKRLGQFTEADALIERLAAAAPDSPDILRLRTERHIRERKLTDAVSTAEQLLTVQSNNPAWASLTADLNIRAGNAKRAEEIARAALADQPGSASLLWSLAKSLVAQKKPDEAEKVVRDSAESRKDAIHFLLLAQLLVELHKTDQAATAIERALAIAPADVSVVGAASDFWGARGDRAKQLSLARQVVVLRKEDPAESLTLATLLTARGTHDEWQEAQGIIQKRLRAHPEDASALVLKARLAAVMHPGKLDEVESTLATALTMDPRSREARGLLADVQLRRGRTPDAVETAAAGLALHPDDPELLLISARIAVHQGDYQQAITPLRKLLAQHPRSLEAQRLLATAFQHTNQVGAAIDLLSRVPEQERTPLELVLLAKLYELQKHFDRAEVLFTQAMQKGADMTEPFREFLFYLARRGRCDEVYALASKRKLVQADDVGSIAIAGELLASGCRGESEGDAGIAWLEEIVAKHPDHAADAATRAALVFYQRREFSRSAKLFEKAVDLDPASAPAVNGLAWLLSEDLGQPGDALAIIDRFLRNGGNPPAEMLDTHAAVLSRLDRPAEAIEKLRACVGLAGHSQTMTAASWRLGNLLMKSGKTAEGRMHLRTALDLNRRLAGLSEDEVQQAHRLLDQQ